MGRTPFISERQILEATAKAICKHGFDVRTSMIAKIGGFSEGSIFRYFKTKNELIDSLFEKTVISIEWLNPLLDNRKNTCTKELLREVTKRGVKHFRKTGPIVMMAASRGIFPKALSNKDDKNSPPFQAFLIIKNFLQQRESLELIRKIDYEAFTQIYIATLMHSVMVEIHERRLGIKPIVDKNIVPRSIELLLTLL